MHQRLALNPLLPFPDILVHHQQIEMCRYSRLDRSSDVELKLLSSLQ